MPQRLRRDYWFLPSAALCLGAGLTTIASYLAREKSVAVLGFEGNALSYTAAASLVALAASLAALVFDRRWPARLFAVLTAVIPAVSLVEDLTATDLQIAVFLGQRAPDAAPWILSRMALESSYGIILAALLLFVLSLELRPALRQIITCALAAITLGVVSASPFELLLHWISGDRYTPVPVRMHEVLSFALLAVPVTVLYRCAVTTSPEHRPQYQKQVLAFAFLSTLVVLFFWRALNVSELNAISREIGFRSEQVAIELRDNLDDFMLVVEERLRSADRAGTGVPPALTAEMEYFLETYPACHTLLWLRPDSRWNILHSSLGAGDRNLDVSIERDLTTLLRAASAMRTQAIAGPVTRRDRQIILTTPVASGRTAPDHLVVYCDARDLVASWISAGLDSEAFSGRAILAGRTVYEHTILDDTERPIRFSTTLFKERSVKLRTSGLEMALMLRPSFASIRRSISVWPDITLLFGVTGILLLAVLVQLVQESERRTREVEAAREEVVRLEESRRIAAERLERFFNLSIDMFAIVDSSGAWRMVNRAWEITLGYSLADLQSTEWINFVHPEDREPTLAAVERFRVGAQIVTLQNRWLARDGSVHWLLWSVNYEPKEELYLIASKDITDLKQSQVKLEASAAELSGKNQELALALATARDAMEARSRFLATVSHEMRTPMNGIIGMTELLLTTPLNAAQREFAVIVKNSSGSLLRMVNDLLDLAKIEAGKLHLETVPFDPAEVVYMATNLMRASAMEKGLTLGAEVPGGLPAMVIGDPDRLRQVLLNLIGNALKFTERGGVRVCAQVLDRAPGTATLRFQVIDTGIGVPAGQTERIFESFAQVDQSLTRKYGGTGLGLTISKQLVEAMGGTITMDSVVGIGSAFSFTISFPLPFAPGVPALSAFTNDVTHMAGVFKILVVEDNPVNQRVALNLLSNSGYVAEAVGSGEDSLNALQRQDYDLVLMDIMMPGMDGVEATAAIRRWENGRRHIPIIAMTANDVPGDRERYLAAGMDDYLSKPIVPATLKEVIDRWLPRQDPGAGSPGSD